MTATRLGSLTLSIAILVGCGSQLGEEDGARCVEVSRTPVARDDASIAGFAPGDLIDAITGEATGVVHWNATDTDTAFTSTLGAPTAIDWVVTEWQDDGSGLMTEMDCAPFLEIAAPLAFATDDGALDESFDAKLAATLATEAHVTLDLDAPAGTFDIWDHVPAGSTYDDATAWLVLSFTDAGVTGVIDGQGSGTDGNDGPDGTAYAEAIDVATIGAATE